MGASSGGVRALTVHCCRPSIEVLFESARDAFGARAAAVLLTGYGEDGARGLCRVAGAGGWTAVQNPASAEVPAMVLSALELAEPDAGLDLEDVAPWLRRIVGDGDALHTPREGSS